MDVGRVFCPLQSILHRAAENQFALHFWSKLFRQIFCCTSRVPHTAFWVLLVPPSPTSARDSRSSLFPETHQSYSSSSLSSCQLTTPWLGWQLLILQSSVPRSFPSRSHPWANNAQSKLAEGAFLLSSISVYWGPFHFLPRIIEIWNCLSLVHLLINRLLSF